VWQERDEGIRQQILRAYVETYLKEEIQVEAQVRNLGAFVRFLQLAAVENGNVLNVIAVTKDVTERVIMHTEAMRAGHLASLGELAAGVAHEINNPVNSIINFN